MTTEKGQTVAVGSDGLLGDECPALVMVKIGGKTFRCHCECNVFHHPKERPDVYECNACGEWYEGF